MRFTSIALLAIPSLVAAQQAPRAIFTDPPHDAKHPARMEVLHIPSWVEHQAEALEDTFELDVFSPIRQDWLDHTDDYFHR